MSEVRKAGRKSKFRRRPASTAATSSTSTRANESATFAGTKRSGSASVDANKKQQQNGRAKGFSGNGGGGVDSVVIAVVSTAARPCGAGGGGGQRVCECTPSSCGVVFDTNLTLIDQALYQTRANVDRLGRSPDDEFHNLPYIPFPAAADADDVSAAAAAKSSSSATVR